MSLTFLDPLLRYDDIVAGIFEYHVHEWHHFPGIPELVQQLLASLEQHVFRIAAWKQKKERDGISWLLGNQRNYYYYFYNAIFVNNMSIKNTLGTRKFSWLANLFDFLKQNGIKILKK